MRVAILCLGAAAWAFFAGCGCDDESADKAGYPLAASADDGAVGVLSALLPELQSGSLMSDQEDLIVGRTAGGDNEITGRALLRFNIANWTAGDLSFNIKCSQTSGSPGGVQVYAVDDFGALPASLGIPDPADMSLYWSLVGSGEKVGETAVEADSWLSVTVPEATVKARKGAAGYLAFAIKLADESIAVGNMYLFESLDYASARDDDTLRPYLE